MNKRLRLALSSSFRRFWRGCFWHFASVEDIETHCVGKLSLLGCKSGVWSTFGRSFPKEVTIRECNISRPALNRSSRMKGKNKEKLYAARLPNMGNLQQRLKAMHSANSSSGDRLRTWHRYCSVYSDWLSTKTSHCQNNIVQNNSKHVVFQTMLSCHTKFARNI